MHIVLGSGPSASPVFVYVVVAGAQRHAGRAVGYGPQASVHFRSVLSARRSRSHYFALLPMKTCTCSFAHRPMSVRASLEVVGSPLPPVTMPPAAAPVEVKALAAAEEAAYEVLRGLAAW